MPYTKPVSAIPNQRRFNIPSNSLGDEEGQVHNVVSENGNQRNSNDQNEEMDATRKFSEVWDFGDPNKTCPYCGAFLWYEERTSKSRNTNDPKFSICCQEGFVRLPLLQDTPPYLKSLLDYSNDPNSKSFRENITSYNSIFAFTSMGGKIDRKIYDGRGPYVFRINGQNHHKIGSLLLETGNQPKFAQLYIYDTENEVSNRRKAIGSGGARINLNEELIQGLISMFDENNELVKVLRMARDRFKDTDYVPVRLRLIATRQKDVRQYNLPTSSEVAALIVGNGHDNDAHRDIIIEEKGLGLRRINQLHASFMALQYPVLFLYGEDGFRINILGSDDQRRKQRKRKRISMREFYACRIQQRQHKGQTLIRGGRLYQQFLVDAYACIEEERLSWVRRNQPRLRSDLYSGLRDAIVAGDTSPASVGKRLILPSSFTGGARYMVQNYQDAMAICRWAGPPSLFITFTCNPKWIEINRFLNLIGRQGSEDRADVVTRVFKIKLDNLMSDLRKGNHFRRVTAAVYSIEFQKRGLPHAHILLFLHPDDNPVTPAHIDKIISAELPDKEKDPLAFASVVQFMVHGPCGDMNKDSPCMKDENCSKHYPKDYCNQTNIDDSGFPIYRRRKNSRKAEKGRNEVDNGWIMPHNIDLIVKYQAHINVELCNQSRAVKYLFKYIHKGNDRATFVIEEHIQGAGTNGEELVKEVDEVKNYLDCRYISASESCWRILEFETQYRNPAVQRLAFHLEDEQPVVFKDTNDLDDVLERDDLDNTKFLEWMKTNQAHPDARDLSYVDFPTKWVWKIDKKIWKRRESGNAVGRIYYAHPTSGERFYLRMLLNMVRGPRSFAEIRTVDGVEHPNFKSACFARGLLEDDNE